MNKIMEVGMIVYLGPEQVFKLRSGLKIKNLNRDKSVRIKVKTEQNIDLKNELFIELSPLQIINRNDFKIQNLKGRDIKLLVY